MFKSVNLKNRIIIFIFMIFPLLISAQSLRSKVNSGNEHYRAGEYEQALSKYNDALLDDQLNEKVLFNQADALFKMEKESRRKHSYQRFYNHEIFR